MKQPSEFRPKKKSRVFTPLAGQEGKLLVWWYGGIAKNQRDQSVPLAAVFFRQLDNEGRLGGFLQKQIALTHLGQIPLGSVVDDGVRVADVVFDTEHFDVDFTVGSWSFVSPSSSLAPDYPNPINQSDYRLRYTRDRNWLLSFPLPGGKSLLIPSLVFYTRAYGHSAEIKRVFATYPWSEARRRLYLPIDEPPTSDNWAVKLAKRMKNADVVLLAHVLYDPYTQRAVRDVYGQIEASFSRENPYAFIKVRPWFQGAATVKVQGIWINGGTTFLALRLLGCSAPTGKPIERDRENTRNVDKPAPEGEGGKAWRGAPRRISFRQLPEIVNLTDTDAPDSDSWTIEAEDDEFETLGTPRVVHDVRRAQAKSSSAKPSPSNVPESYSTGDTHGKGKDVGHASIHAPQALESRGTLRDMWNAMLHARRKYPSQVKAVSWFTLDRGFCSDPTPQLIPLKPFEDSEAVTTDKRNWLYFDVDTQTPRGVLVAKLNIQEKQVFILEVQRRGPPTGKQKKATGESFKGLIFILERRRRLKGEIGKLLSSIRHVKGVVQKLENDFPGEAWAFKHVPSRDDKVPCEAALNNALKKMGISLQKEEDIEQEKPEDLDQ